jgi:glutamyl-tRNA synthetase
MTSTSSPAPIVRTRFAPSPTGYLHIGGARTALFSWAFARHHGGEFVLRIEDTDVERSTPAAVQAIMDGMSWLELHHDEGPHYQMQRLERYREVIAQMLNDGTAYLCYCSKEELEHMRAAQEARGEKAKYDGRWRPEQGKSLPTPPAGVPPVVRFKNPLDGHTAWDDLIKGPISFANEELDDLVIARPDGTPTYNFCVVVDDRDMRITHVIRGDDHVNNTPRQINIMRALGAQLPRYGHVPMIHGADGQKLSKRHGAVSVTQFDDDGYLTEAVVNYLARLGWSHGDEEVFSREQFVAWFDGNNIARSPARFDYEKLKWLNNHYLKGMDNDALAQRVLPRLARRGVIPSSEQASLAQACALWKDRARTLEELADFSALLYRPAPIPNSDRDTHLKHSPGLAAALAGLRQELSLCAWEPAAVSVAIKAQLAAHGMKMQQLAMPLRLWLFGTAQTPSLDAMVVAVPREEVLQRLHAVTPDASGFLMPKVG